MHKFVEFLKARGHFLSVVFDNLENVRTALTLLETHCPEIKWFYGKRNPLSEYNSIVRQANGQKIYLEIVFSIAPSSIDMLCSFTYQSETDWVTFCENCYSSDYMTYMAFLEHFVDDNRYIIINKEVI